MAKLPLLVFTRLRIIPQVILIEAYILTKVFFVLFEIFTTFWRQKVARTHPNYSVCCLVAYCSGMVCGCGCCCLCCCNCCRRKPGTWSTALTYYINLITRINCYFVKLLLGPGAIVSRKSAMYKPKKDVDKYGVSKIYLRNKELSHREVSAFAVITFTFGLIVLVAVWNQVLQERIIGTCSVEVGTSCYPQLSDNSSAVDFAVSTDQPIDDCSYWNSESVSNYVEGFQCFQLRFDLLAILSRFGGLLSLMLLVLRITFSLALATIDSTFENFLQSSDDKKCWYKTKLNSLIAIVKTGRIFLAFIAYSIELLAISIIQRRLISSPNFQVGFEVVLVIGLLTSSLLLPLEEYSLAQDQAGGGVTPLSWQQSVDHQTVQSPEEDDENDSFRYHKLQSFDSVDYQRDISEA